MYHPAILVSTNLSTTVSLELAAVFISTILLGTRGRISLQVSYRLAFLGHYYIILTVSPQGFPLSSFIQHFHPFSVLLHTMYFRISRPLPKRLPLIPEDNPTRAPQNNQSHIRHNWRNISTLLNPRRDEFRESISPKIFIYGDSNEDGPCDGFVGIDRVGG